MRRYRSIALHFVFSVTDPSIVDASGQQASQRIPDQLEDEGPIRRLEAEHLTGQLLSGTLTFGKAEMILKVGMRGEHSFDEYF
jgi:hypothetical protein